MKRREFLAGLSASIPFFSFLSACRTEEGLYSNFEVNFSGKVLVIGAGASGLAAGYILERYGIDFEIIEASGLIGGRVKRTDDFVDVPIDLGAEWIHEDPYVLTSLIDDPTIDADIEVVPYSPDTVSIYSDGELSRANFGANYYSEYKFKRTTWHSFLENYIAKDIMDRVRLNSPVASIDYSGDQAVVTDEAGNTYTGDRVLVTVPIKILQGDSISFTPALPESKTQAINQVNIPPGLKVSIEFSEKFYPDITLMGLEANQLYIDGVFRKEAQSNVMTMFFVSDEASRFTDLDDDDAIIEAVLAELDEVFDGKASENYIQHIVQNWSAEPYIQGAYSFDYSGDETEIIAVLGEPVENKIFFSGEACSSDNTATVPGAMQSAYAAVEVILRG